MSKNSQHLRVSHYAKRGAPQLRAWQCNGEPATALRQEPLRLHDGRKLDVPAEELYFKGVRCVQALQRVLENITASNVVCMQVSMLVMTLSLGCNLDVRCHGTLHQKLKYTFGPAIKFLFRSEEQSNAVLFSVQDWRQIFKAAGNDYTWKHDLVPSTTISFTQNGSCTLRMTFQGKRDLAQWSEPFAQAHEAAIAIGSVLISLAQS
jgi:hypothetical protein